MSRAYMIRTLAMFYAILVVTPVPAAERLQSIGLPGDVGVFDAVDGKPAVVRRGTQRPGNALDWKGGSIVHYGSGKSLGYDLEGKDAIVRLGPREATGYTWKLTKIEGRGGGMAIEATEGKFKGWFLDCTDVEAPDDPRALRRLILVQTPRNIKRFSLYDVAK